VDVVGFVRGLNLFDLLLFVLTFAFFVVGFIQGTLRRLLGLAIVVVSLLFATNLRDPIGSWLAQYWTQFPPEYSYMLAFGGSFLLLFAAGSVAVQTFYHHTPLFAHSTFLDELIGGILGVVQATLPAGILVMILDSYFRATSFPVNGNELGFLRSLYEAYDPSQSAVFLRGIVVPGFLTLFAWIVPASLRSLFP
jgi:uncharacterized membrane protein required for colicin V production